MKNTTKRILLTSLAIGFISIIGAAQAKIIVVNNVDNTNLNPGVTNLLTAFNILSNNDTITFNITNAPATGPQHILTPTNGYPMLTNMTNITIDGYSQPGSSPNTATILSSNNATVTVYLDSSNGQLTDLSLIHI